MNELVTKRTNGQPAYAGTIPVDPFAGLPGWIRLLIGAYPAAKSNEYTFAVYESAFSDVDSDTMLEAVKRAVGKHRFHTWPLVPELREVVEAVQAERETAVIVVADLHADRADLLEAAYAGEVDPAAFMRLAKLYRVAGCEFAAANLERKLTVMGTVEDARPPLMR